MGQALITAVGLGLGLGFLVAGVNDALGVVVGVVTGMAGLVAMLRVGYRRAHAAFVETSRVVPAEQ